MNYLWNCTNQELVFSVPVESLNQVHVRPGVNRVGTDIRSEDIRYLKSTCKGFKKRLSRGDLVFSHRGDKPPSLSEYSRESADNVSEVSTVSAAKFDQMLKECKTRDERRSLLNRVHVAREILRQGA